MLLSIVIPVYNSKKEYLEELLQSLEVQDLSDVEIIIVNDGSDEEHSSELQAILEKRETIVYIKKENGGVSSARNFGIQVANGNYISFADSDDIFSPDFICSSIDYIRKYKPDIIFGTMKVFPHTYYLQTTGTAEFFEKNNIDDIEQRFSCTGKYGIIGSTCSRIYKKEIVSRVKFHEDILYSEDQLFNREIIKHAERVLVVPDEWYVYRDNPCSATHSNMYNQNYYQKIKGYWRNLLNIYKTCSKATIHAYRVEALVNAGFAYKRIASSDLPFPRKIAEIKIISNDEYVKDAVCNLRISDELKSLAQKIQLILMKVNAYLPLLILYDLFIIRKRYENER
ncbi:glycosyltransferase family 2 protein [Butyrivibrio sp. AE2015]|uniref:glycosyltransferase family 2 protein n=1 Tax=Butyrivibrio sp. AE2015 TaxID=1280663 RepID=UPI0003B5E9F0|nr:glycosyltransferase family 2 protein [Butyrivibrio sp. AE2015]